MRWGSLRAQPLALLVCRRLGVARAMGICAFVLNLPLNRLQITKRRKL